MRITLAQLDPRLGDVDADADLAEKVIADAAADGSDIVVFPELFLSGFAAVAATSRWSARPGWA